MSPISKCPACGNEKSYFVDKICGDCHARGLDLNAGMGREEGPMTERFRKEACKKGCGREIGVNQLAKHEKVCQGPKEPKVKRRKPSRRKRPKGAGQGKSAMVIAATACLLCGGGKDLALTKDLLAEAIREGMTFDGAIRFVGRVRLLIGSGR